ncbi:zinc finger cchc domain-containing protein 9 [Lasius niger]|uniref:Zinc finger cchc domain-containing protein 9 n=1 Tax=Lasius niger TaxID=67767 RepID=A0A0J7KYQ7_LASNI|nr:zinc finger cchc domain-containing protein 9 [Lasius niger]
MTRYARARGSKASNEKLPNNATPWHIMKQQIGENENKNLLEKKKSAKELLMDQNDTLDNTNKNVNHNWAEFNDNRSKSDIKEHKKSKSKRNRTNFAEDSKNDITPNNNNAETEDTKIETIDGRSDKVSNKMNPDVNNSYLPSSEKESRISQDDKHSNSSILSKRQKRNRKRKLEASNDESKRFKEDTSDKSDKVEEKKIKEKGKYKRRKPNAGVTKIIINGVEIEIVMYDGFPVKKEDAERLTELKQKLIMKGVPKSEVDMAMKLERRRAEKALARVKKQVCFNCRKSGHNLSDCPELGRDEACTGICFKCGSTEHTHFECKVNKDSTYRYAKCFICREQGHIAVECPDNPKGIYPHGGCCKICGAVTHLKKDCPDLVKGKEDSAITVEKMDDFAIESLQEDVKKNGDKLPKNKIIKF